MWRTNLFLFFRKWDRRFKLPYVPQMIRIRNSGENQCLYWNYHDLIAEIKRKSKIKCDQVSGLFFVIFYSKSYKHHYTKKYDNVIVCICTVV